MTQYKSIKDYAECKGFSEYFVRKQVQEGRFPHIRSGVKIYIDTAGADQILQREANEAVRGGEVVGG